MHFLFAHFINLWSIIKLILCAASYIQYVLYYTYYMKTSKCTDGAINYYHDVSIIPRLSIL